ncbi:KAP family NTPase [Aeromonas salmonicida]|uniref:KAP family NTPase n=1 Tax=Aeromonas salmonicida TaxID=645 RepID=UPI00259D8A53|nr:KAP family NTPase [Aeromonas salmonicida]MDM5101182.1 KAP family NTPase [Aeromonas salmonicida]
MASKPLAMKMPELLVFARMLFIGFVGAEVARIFFLLGTSFAQQIVDVSLCLKAIGVLIGLGICLIYAVKRNAHLAAMRIVRSYRIDLLAGVVIGAWSNKLASPWLAKIHAAFQSADPQWAPAILLLFCFILLSPFLQKRSSSKKQTSQIYFIADEEIEDKKDDLLTNEVQAKSFAETVLASGSHPGLVFGVDGPWGVGKTSFINLVERYWEDAADKVLVCRFEPLRYASEPDLADRLIRDLSAVIQDRVFAPEFRPAASRYSRLIKGKADVSFLGFKLSLEPSQETVDELLDDIDEVLRRIDRRVIIVIDDLDRLDAKTINNVLFATRRTFKLSQATYVLCYDTEVLTGNKEEGERAREFLEKFVTVKLSLFVDTSSLCDFLQRDWEHDENQLGSVPSDTMIKLGVVLNELADILGSNLAANYLPFVGNLRKLKRFINAMLLMQIEKTDLGRTDFHKRDLINLMLLHLSYPGLFRRIYAEEIDGRSGTFSLRREHGGEEFKNAETFTALKDELPAPAWFLLSQLFDKNILENNYGSNIDEAERRARACFNSGSFRNLEAYLKLIVRFATPEPRETFVLYQSAVERVKEGASISSILTSPDFELMRGEHAHDQFWRVLVNQSYSFTNVQAEDAIETLIKYLPQYSAFDRDDRGLRQRSIYSLVRLLDRAGWGRTSGRHLPNSSDNVIEIAWRLFGEESYQGAGLIERIASHERGVLGWNDLMLIRLLCSADRQGSLHNVYTALIVHQDKTAATSGVAHKLSLMGMRKLSQEVFALFKRTYIDSQRNFFAEVNDTPVGVFLGVAFSVHVGEASQNPEVEHDGDMLARRVAIARGTVKTFVIYQLSNSNPPNASGVGCGFYDETGLGDSGGIAKVMSDYMFGTCFNPQIHENNVLLFLDYCLSNLSSSFFWDSDEGDYIATKAELSGSLDPKAMGRYWLQHREQIRGLNLETRERCVFTSNYTAFYRDGLDGVFTVLDELADECSMS